MRKLLLSFILIFTPTIFFSVNLKAVGHTTGEGCCFHNFPFDQNFLLKNGEAENEKPSSPKIAHPLPFLTGEKLFYEINFEKLIFSGKIGEMTLQAEKAERAKPNAIQLKGEIVSKGFFNSLFK